MPEAPAYPAAAVELAADLKDRHGPEAVLIAQRILLQASLAGNDPAFETAATAVVLLESDARIAA